jgi:DNA-binding transcriptional LysR family regulator
LLDLVQVRTFAAVAREGSFTRAASTLHYAQSSVTAQVQGLEEHLGAPLFHRLPRSLELTQVGQAFLPHAERLLALADEAVQSAHAHGQPAGALTLSACESVLTYRLPALLQRFQRDHPQVQIVLHAASVCEFGPPIQSGVDVGVSISERIQDPQLITHVLRAETIRAVVAREHPLATRRRITPADIVSEQLLLTEETCSYRSVFEEALRDAGARPSHALAFASVEAIKQCALSRMGIAVLPEMVVADNLRAGTLVALRWPSRTLKVYTQLVRRRDRWFSPAMQAFWQAAIETVGVEKKAVKR